MVGQLLTLPLRIGARGTQIALRTVEGVAGRTAMGALQLVGMIKGRGSTQSPNADTDVAQEPSRTQPPREDAAQTGAAAEAALSRETPIASPGSPAPIVSAPVPVDLERPIAPEPTHVSEEPELVREEAEPGAEDGAGAAVTVRPPWKGYERMAAREVIARLGDATAAELAAVELYERSNRSRQTVLEAVERRMKTANGRG